MTIPAFRLRGHQIHRCGRALSAAQRRARPLSRPHPPYPCEGATVAAAACSPPSCIFPARSKNRSDGLFRRGIADRAPPRTQDGSPAGSTSCSARLRGSNGRAGGDTGSKSVNNLARTGWPTMLYRLYNGARMPWRNPRIPEQVRRPSGAQDRRNSIGFILPKETAGCFQLEEGDRLFVVEQPDGGLRRLQHDRISRRRWKSLVVA